MLYTKGFPAESMFASAYLHGKTGSYYIDVWISVQNEPAEPHVILNAQVPVYGETPREAGGAVVNVVDRLASIAPTLWSGTGAIDARKAHGLHALSHLQFHGKLLEANDGLSGTRDVAAMYLLLGEFNIKNPAQMIADFCEMETTRPIHELIADARKEGLIPSYGKGKSRP